MRFTILPIFLLLASCVRETAPVADLTQRNASAIPASMNDPFEGTNRALWAANRGLLTGVVQPTTRVYRAIVPEPARRSIGNFTNNITYPGRLVNNVLQGRWQGAGNESLRFLTNTTAGVGGLFDVATRWNIPRSNAGFAQTLACWGWRSQGTYLMLPFFGPSDPRHAVGLAGDAALDPRVYLETPYSYISAGTGFNDLAGNTEARVRFVKSESDPYETSKFLWTVVSRDQKPDWTPHGAPDPATLQTLGVATLETDDPHFPEHAKERSALIPATGKKLPYLLWLQRGHAPLAYVVPGLGSHRYAATTQVLAERLYQNGFSVVAVSSMFHPEFIRTALTSELPAYPPNDCRDLHAALTAIDGDVEHRYPGRFGERIMAGLSMGGFQALYLAGTESRQNPSFVRFSKYLAIDTPVELSHGIGCLDSFAAVPEKWPADQRQARITNIFAKGASLMEALPPPGVVPFSDNESKYLIGLSFRFVLRDAIYATQERHNLGIIKAPLDRWHRDAAYREIGNISYTEYLHRFVLPVYGRQGVSAADFRRETSLLTKSRNLAGQRKAHVIANRNDFLLTPSNRAWLRSTFGTKRCEFAPSGGHLGNLAGPAVRGAISRAVSGVR